MMERWMLFSKPWKQRPWWSKWHDIINVGLITVILLFVIWEAVGRWLGR